MVAIETSYLSGAFSLAPSIQIAGYTVEDFVYWIYTESFMENLNDFNKFKLN